MGLAHLFIGDDIVLQGSGFGAHGVFVGELCFATAMTGYQEILTDPSYFGQILCFTFPHIGNTGANEEDIESSGHGVRAFLTADMPTQPSNWRMHMSLDTFAKERGIIGMAGVDTRAITQLVCQKGDIRALVAHHEDGCEPVSLTALKQQLEAWPNLDQNDLARMVTCREAYTFAQGTDGCVVVVDFGVKGAILAALAACRFTVVVVPATCSAQDILAYKPCGVVLSNGPGDPHTTLLYSQNMIQTLIGAGIPMLGICLGHQLIALALGAQVHKMHTGHRGINHPVKDLEHKKVIITTMNHGYAVDASTLPLSTVETYVSLFDGTNCGFRLIDKPVMAVQFHPEASAGPKDAFSLFHRFKALMA